LDYYSRSVVAPGPRGWA